LVKKSFYVHQNYIDVFVDGMGVFIVKVGTILGLAERFSHYKNVTKTRNSSWKKAV
jgi:hypothetical protein